MNKKILTIVVLVFTLLLSGCVSDEKKMTEIKSSKFKRFQSVELEKTTMLQIGKDKHSCPVCGMKLPMFYKTNHSATSNGKVKQYCSIPVSYTHLTLPTKA